MRPKHAVSDHSFQFQDGRMVLQDVSDHQDAIVFVRQVCQLLTFVSVKGQ